MNYLAHVLLSGSELEWQLGGFLGDFIKGPIASEQILDQQGLPWSLSVARGVALHRTLDAYVDQLPAYKHCIELLGPEYRRIGGIVMDVIFDHLLVNHWDNFGDQELLMFSRQFYRFCDDQHERLPVRAAGFIRAATDHDLFVAYGRADIISSVLGRIASRLKYATNLEEAGELALDKLDDFEPHFLEVMSLLIKFSADFRSRNS